MPGYHDSMHTHRRLNCFSFGAIEEYFAQLNPIAKRITYDINDTKAKYGQLWNTLDYHEQTDIINDTLIKPEISLRYFDHFATPTPTNSTANSYQSSTDSLTAIVLKDVGVSKHCKFDQKNGEIKNSPLKTNTVKFNPHGMKNVYSYDGRNLHTFGMQKVALKVIQDDALGCFRDEHSRPFCYRTKSQINLFVLSPITDPPAARNTNISNKIAANFNTKTLNDNCLSEDKSKTALDNYERLQYQLKLNLMEKKSQDLHNSSCTPTKHNIISSNRKIINKSDASFKQETKDKMPFSKNTKSSILQNYINSTQINASQKVGISYAIFSDAHNTGEESFNLLQHCGQSDLNIGSCSSAATSDDEKTLEENVHLLDSDSNIRKGFDFLNNW